MAQYLRIIGALGLTASAALAQSTHLTAPGDLSGMRFGDSVAVIGDLNLDNVPEVLIGAPNDAQNGVRSGAARVIDGSNGIPIYDLLGSGAFESFGAAVSAAGDWNGDNTPDFAVGAPEASLHGEVRIYSGATGVELAMFPGGKNEDRFGSSLALIGDVDGDSTQELLMGAPNAKAGPIRPGRAYVVSPVHGLLFTLTGNKDGDSFGAALDGIGDVTRDGTPDYIIGAPLSHSSIVGSRGSVWVYSGATGTLVKTRRGSFLNDRFGSAVAGIGDVNGDLTPDVLITAPFASSANGIAQVFSGRNGKVLYEIEGAFSSEGLGHAVAGGADVDGDSVPDFAVNATGDTRFAEPGNVRVFSGATGALIYTVAGDDNSERFGSAIAMGGEFNGDLNAEVIVGANNRDGLQPNSGAVMIYTGGAAMQIGPPLPGVAGAQNTVAVNGAEPNSMVSLYRSHALGGAQISGCGDLSLNLSVPSLLGSAASDAQGRATISFLAPPTLSKTTQYFQVIDSGNCRVSHNVVHTFP